jgi:hypothetical protein
MISANYRAALLDIAGPQLRDVADYWITGRPGNAQVEAAGTAAYRALEALSPQARGACFFDAIRRMHFQRARGRPRQVTWPEVPLTAIDDARLPLRADVSTADLSDWIIDLMMRLSQQDLAFTDAMLCELLILMRHPEGRIGAICLPLLDHLEAAAKGDATQDFRRELDATAGWLKANAQFHDEDYLGKFQQEAERRLCPLAGGQ